MNKNQLIYLTRKKHRDTSKHYYSIMYLTFSLSNSCQCSNLDKILVQFTYPNIEINHFYFLTVNSFFRTCIMWAIYFGYIWGLYILKLQIVFCQMIFLYNVLKSRIIIYNMEICTLFVESVTIHRIRYYWRTVCRAPFKLILWSF